MTSNSSAELDNQLSDQAIEFEEDGELINMQIKIGREDANEFGSEDESELEKESDSDSENSNNPSESESVASEHSENSGLAQE